MIVYQANKAEFLLDFNDRDIEDVIHACLLYTSDAADE